MKYTSTRNNKISITGSEAIVKGLADDGGLYVPESFPQISLVEIKKLENMEYFERAAFIMHEFLPEFDKDDLLEYTLKAYQKFEDGEIAPVLKIDEGMYMMELWHGPTHAFKDVALTVLPYLLTHSKKLVGNTDKTLILTATSGDTGKAALEGFKDVNGIDIIVFYPQDGVSAAQKLQMQTTTGKNVKVFGINGNFDDAQTAVKNVFADKEADKQLKELGYSLSSANSINFGRLLPQIVYYFSAYSDLAASEQIKYGDKINFCVPTGNFGNILAGYYAKRMGLPINKLICASNKNNVLTDFLNEGEYNSKREFFKTSSPSMDILISSNLERLIFELSDRDSELTAKRMAELKDSNKYSVSEKELEVLHEEFFGDYADEEEVRDTLANYFDEYGYIADPHTSVAIAAFGQYVAETDDQSPTVILSTASPYKFAGEVLTALGEKPSKSEMGSLTKLEGITALPIPESLANLAGMPIIHKDTIDRKSVLKVVTEYCKNKK